MRTQAEEFDERIMLLMEHARKMRNKMDDEHLRASEDIAGDDDDDDDTDERGTHSSLKVGR